MLAGSRTTRVDGNYWDDVCLVPGRRVCDVPTVLRPEQHLTDYSNTERNEDEGSIQVHA